MTQFEKKIKELKDRFDSLERDLQKSDVSSNPQKLQQLSKEYNEIKEILDLNNQLEKVEKEIKDIDVGVERSKSEREEGEGNPQEIDKEIMFENAPKKNKDFIIAEKKGW